MVSSSTTITSSPVTNDRDSTTSLVDPSHQQFLMIGSGKVGKGGGGGGGGGGGSDCAAAMETLAAGEMIQSLKPVSETRAITVMVCPL